MVSRRVLPEWPHLGDPCTAQVGKGMNRDYWARFERFVQLLTNTCDDVWIVTGPLYLPRPSQDGWRMDYRLLGAWVIPLAGGPAEHGLSLESPTV